MSDETIPDRSRLPLDVLDRIDRACDRFEAAWYRGERPRVEDYLGEAAPPYRRALLRDLLAAELAARRRRGESPSPGEYRERLPGDVLAVDSIFGVAGSASTSPVQQAVEAGPGLLVALLAYQTGLIDETTLVEALRAWVADKARPMADVLAGMGAVDGPRRALLEGLAAEHLGLHGGDVASSLGALPAGESTRERLTRLGDADLDATIAHVGSGPRPTAGRDRTDTFVIGDAVAKGQRFRVLRPHARGGLGAVFVALDAELNREVALKRILDHHADDPTSRSRFLVEAEITGGLEHPGIVPVYGLGTYGDGRPYYAMRFIRGDSLKEAIAAFHADASLRADPGRRSVELRKLLRRFLDVCNAIDYAHSRGVLHRDIKPGNVIVGKYGETLVIDWGLAKVSGHKEAADNEERPLMPPTASGSAETLPGSALGTPAYMSPEQAAGELSRLGVQSDVYSLGATLYCLLTGKAPFEGDDVGALLLAVRGSRFPPPRRLDSALDRGLEAVCLKAMAREPEGRYDSARALADELDRWLADEPVTACREGWGRRLGRWMRRHRAATQAAAAALVVITAVSIVAAALINQARVRVDLARLAESRAKDDARANFARARGTVDDYLTLVSRSVELRRDLPGLQKFRAELLGKALDYYRAFADEHAGNPQLEVEVADAYARVARVTQEIGSKQQALADSRKALDWSEASARSAGGFENQALAGRAELYRLQGLAQYGLGRVTEAIRSMRIALDLYGQAMAARPDDPELLRVVGSIHGDIGVAYILGGHQTEAEASFIQAREFLDRALAVRPGEAKIRELIGGIDNNLGLVQRNLGRLTEAATSFRRARDLDRALIAADPLDFRAASFLANNCMNLGNTLQRLGRIAEAEESFAEGAGALEPLLTQHPDVVQYKEQAANLASQWGALQIGDARPDAAKRSWVQASGLLAQVIRADPKNSTARVVSATVDNNLGMLATRAGRLDEAVRLTARGAAGLDQFLAAQPEQAEARFERSNLGYNLGLLARLRGRNEESARQLDVTQDHLATLRKVDPRTAHYRRLDAQARCLRSIAAAALGDLTRARDEASRAESLIKESSPADANLLYDLACAQAQLGAALARLPVDREASDTSASFLDRASSTLMRAVELGYRDIANLSTDPDLEPIRRRPGFEAVLRDAAMPVNPFRVDR